MLASWLNASSTRKELSRILNGRDEDAAVGGAAGAGVCAKAGATATTRTTNACAMVLAGFTMSSLYEFPDAGPIGTAGRIDF